MFKEIRNINIHQLSTTPGCANGGIQRRRIDGHKDHIDARFDVFVDPFPMFSRYRKDA